MCGIVGVFDPCITLKKGVADLAHSMAQKLTHRGPDDIGVWSDDNLGVALAHTRLSILDLSSAGHQPFISNCGKYGLVFNGEIYNHREIRRELEKSGLSVIDRWRSHSDTEVLLVAILEWGIERVLQLVDGMFAFAFWDSTEKALYLVRDRVGEKPIYYGLQDDLLIFSSELKGIKSCSKFKGEISKRALNLFFHHRYVPAPYSIYNDIYKLIPGSYLKIRLTDVVNGVLPAPVKYWSFLNVAKEGQLNLFSGSEFDAKKVLDYLLSRSVSQQMLADVPVGAFLSGGVDSTMVTAIMATQVTSPVRTFTIGFAESSYNEADYAKSIAHFLGCTHKEHCLRADEALKIIPRLPHVYDEPFADASQIPMMLLSMLAREDVSVCLSGDGGDELFGGYSRHIHVASIWRKFCWMPRNIRLAFAGLITTFPLGQLNQLFSKLELFLPSKWQYRNIEDKLHKLAEILPAGSPEEMYELLVSIWNSSDKIIVDYSGARGESWIFSAELSGLDLEHRMLYLDSVTYLPDNVLTKVDRAAMSASLETRMPFLGREIIDFAWRLPLDMKIHNGEGKRILRNALYDRVPRALIDRPKMGFGIPIDLWLHGPLRKWAEDLLDRRLIDKQGILKSDIVHSIWSDYIGGKKSLSQKVWSLLMFQSWLLAQTN